MSANRLLRNESSCEIVLDCSSQKPLSSDERSEAWQRFYKIVVHFESKHAATHTATINWKTFNQATLIKLTYEYSRSELSKDGFLRVFFETMDVPMGGDITGIDLSDPVIEVDLEEKVAEFANYLMANFFMPLMANMGKTPQVTPATDSAVAKLQGGHEVVGTTGRLATLRRDCLVRDRHRCVITRAFDKREAELRMAIHNNNATDDDGVVFNSNPNEKDTFAILQVAHIIPHALVELGKKNDSATLDPTRKAAMNILNMFDHGVSHMLEGVDIDRPRNAVTLTTDIHDDFGRFRTFFTAVEGQDHTYDIQTFQDPFLAPGLPVRRTLYLTPERTIDPPSPRLLAIHRAIAHILELSGAGKYIERVLRDLEETAVRSDGTTPLANLVKLGLSGLLPGKVNA